MTASLQRRIERLESRSQGSLAGVPTEVLNKRREELLLSALTSRVVGKPGDAIRREAEAMRPVVDADDEAMRAMSDEELHARLVYLMSAGLTEHGEDANLLRLLADAGDELAQQALEAHSAAVR